MDLTALLGPRPDGAASAERSGGCAHPPTGASARTGRPPASVGPQPRVDAAGAACEARLPLPPFGVEALDNAGQATALVARVVLTLGQEATISTPVVCVDWPTPVVRRHLCPGPRKRPVAAVTQRKAEHLPGQAGDAHPQPQGRSHRGGATARRTRSRLRRARPPAAGGAPSGAAPLFSHGANRLTPDLEGAGDATLGDALP